MTERPPAAITQIAIPAQIGVVSAALVSGHDAPQNSESVDDEPYTIKCICEYLDDDGNTIYCESCDTWQHIECYYPGRTEDASKEEFDHSCVDCVPRLLDSRHATERQRQQRHNKAINDTSDKKSKRPPSKSHKKKSRPTEVQVNGYSEHDGHKNGSPQENPPHTKKVKGHRSTQSLSSKRSPSVNTKPNSHTHPPSPAHTPPDLPHNFQIHSYSDNFLSLYDNDHSTQISTTNSFASLAVTNTMSLWLHDPARLQEDAGVKDRHDVFRFLTVTCDGLSWPDLRIDRKEATIDSTVLQWRSLITPTYLPPGRIAELNGLVGFQKDYCNDTANRWTESAHPRPFIFFHPRLPLFIDTRQEGSKCRYVRRSCRANTGLDTFIASGSEYHFWLVSEQPLSANEQITIPWDFRFPSQFRSRFLYLLNLNDDEGPPSDGTDMTDDEYEQLTSTISIVLSDYGGCACGLASDCAFARFHRNYHGRLHSHANGVKVKKARKPKQNHVSPTSTGHATNSRAASEGQEQYEEDDNRSQSDSVRSKPHSRDLTPSHGVNESNGILTQTSDREKRKLAMLEDSFRKMETQPMRKKKRVSDGSNTNASSITNSQQQTKPKQRSVGPRASISQQPPVSSNSGSRPRQYVDATTSRRQSGSPFSGISPTAAVHSPINPASRSGSIPTRPQAVLVSPRATYRDSSTQTDHIDGAWWESKTKSKRRVVSLANRLLRNRLRITQTQQEPHGVPPGPIADDQCSRASPAASMDLDIPTQEHVPEWPTDSRGCQTSISSSSSVDFVSGDVNMTDLPSMDGGSVKPLPPTWPSQQQNNHTTATEPIPTQHSLDLRLQMPPGPVFSTPNMSGPLSGPVTPSQHTSSTAQSPLGTVHFPPNVFSTSVTNGIGPNPAKTTKKLSMSDYRARKQRTEISGANKSSTVINSVAAPAALKATVEELTPSNASEGPVVTDSPSPVLEKSLDPSASAPETHSAASLVNGAV